MEAWVPLVRASLGLSQAIQQGTIKCNFSGVALGDSWISPVGKYGVFSHLSLLTLTLPVTLNLLWDFSGKARKSSVPTD